MRAGPRCLEARFAKQAHGFSLVPTFFRKGRGACKPPGSQSQPSALLLPPLSARLGQLNRFRLGQRPALLLSSTPTTASLSRTPPPDPRAAGGAARASSGKLDSAAGRLQRLTPRRPNPRPPAALMDCPGRQRTATLEPIRPTRTYLIPINRRHHLTTIELKNKQPGL